MNSLKRSNWMKHAGLALLAISLGGSLASAQEFAGQFNLPLTAHWGGVVLTPGQYSFMYGTVTPGGTFAITVRRGPRNLGMIMPLVLTSEGQSNRTSYLTATPTAGGFTVTSLELGGIRLRFAMPKGEVLEASQTSRSARDVPILRASR